MAGENDVGISGALSTSVPIAIAISIFVALALYNVIELTCIIFMTFKKRSGLYFWSFLVASWGIVPYALGFFFKFFGIIPVNMVSVTLIVIGWACMVTGQSVVLYSRLHLVIRNTTKVRWVLIMIIFNAIILHIPIFVLAYGSNSANPQPFVTPYSIYEKVQVTVFFIQECIISGLYVYETVRILGATSQIRSNVTRGVLKHLIWVNVVVILLDITLLGIEYSGHYEIQVTYKAALYSIKLKLEFSILNKLVSIFQQGHSSTDQQRSHRSHPSIPLDNVTNGGGKWKGRSKYANSMGYTAYAKMDDGTPVQLGEESRCVVRTTEVKIEHSDAVPKKDTSSTITPHGLQDAGSTLTIGEKPRRSSMSIASSQVQFAEAGS